MRLAVLHALQRPARGSARSCSGGGSRSFPWSTSVRAHRGGGAAAKATAPGPGELPRRRLEVTRLDAPDRIDHDGPAAVEVLTREQPLAIVLESGGVANAEDDLPHIAPDPFLRVPQRQEPRLEAERLALLVESLFAGDVVKSELHVVELRPEVRFVGVFHGLARAGLVVDHLDLAIADVVDSVDLSDDVGPIQLQPEATLGRKRPQAPDLLQAGNESDVVRQQRSDLALFALAVEHTLHVHEGALEVALQRGLEPLLLLFAINRPPSAFLPSTTLNHLT